MSHFQGHFSCWFSINSVNTVSDSCVSPTVISPKVGSEKKGWTAPYLFFNKGFSILGGPVTAD